MSAPVLVLLYLAEVLSSFTGTIPHGEPCEIRSASSSDWHAFTWDAEHRLVGVESYARDELRLRAVLRWSGARLERIEWDMVEPLDQADLIFTIRWRGAYPVEMVRESPPHGQMEAPRRVTRWTWSRDHRSARIASEDAGPPEVRMATFDASGRLLSITGDDPADPLRIALEWSPDGRLLTQRTRDSEHRFTHDASGRVATRTLFTGAERYRYECPAR
jgi:YD repeat-containing protein